MSSDTRPAPSEGAMEAARKMIDGAVAEILDGGPSPLQTAIARALDAAVATEREECAKLAGNAHTSARAEAAIRGRRP